MGKRGESGAILALLVRSANLQTVRDLEDHAMGTFVRADTNAPAA
jgi:hypothetical protein